MGLIKFKICGVLKFENYLRYLIKFLLSLVLWNIEFWKGVYVF